MKTNDEEVVNDSQGMNSSCLVSSEKSVNSPIVIRQNNVDNVNCSSQKSKRYTPDKKGQFRFQGIFNSPLQTIHEKTKGKEIQWVSTPTRKSVVTPSVNPFDIEVDSLSMSSFSPSVFTVTRKKSQEGVSFRWSIEQLAALEPVDIDETSQQLLCVDSEKEVKAQKAIDVFFSKNHIAPSPWTPTVRCMTVSPHITSSSRRSHIEVHKIPQFSNSFEDPTPAKEVSTQTMLTIPPNPPKDLMKLLEKFCTYHEDDSASSSSSSSSSSDADRLSTSSLRRKLFINEDKLESPALIKNQTHNGYVRCATPEIKATRICPTPSSDHFSSSPITPRNWSLSPNQISLLSPNISPICLKPRKKSFISRLSQEDAKSEAIMKIDDHPPSVSLEIASTFEIESSCNTTWDMSRQENVIQQENSYLPAFPNNYTDSSSNQRDTGYMTGSLNSMMNSQQTSSYMHFRATPVAELLEDCAITKLNQKYPHQQDTNGILQSLKASGDDDLSMMSFCCDQSSTNALKNVPWNPSGFSTPTKGSRHLEPI